MKKTLLLLLCVSTLGYAQTQPIIHNGTFDKIAKNSGSDCACSGWINKSIADQGESSSSNDNDVVKLDDFESDGIYQEVAVVANNSYELDLEYTYKVSPTTTSYIEVIVLKGSKYVDGYTPLYAAPATAAQDDFGYDAISDVESAENQIAKFTITPPGDTSTHDMTTLAFETGSETSIAIFVRAVGTYDASNHGDATKDKGWMNGDAEVRLDNLTLENVTEELSSKTLVDSDFNIYPNPVKDVLNIDADDINVNAVEIYSVTGQKVLAESSLSNQLNVSNLSSGVYMLKIYADGKTLVKKIIKE